MAANLEHVQFAGNVVRAQRGEEVERVLQWHRSIVGRMHQPYGRGVGAELQWRIALLARRIGVRPQKLLADTACAYGPPVAMTG